jgi:TolB-like protein/tetratricopeptide (TPR) repeat protein
MSLFQELKRRNVFKVVTGYVILGWLVLQIGDVLVPTLNLPEWTMAFLLIVGVLGFPFVVFFAWAFEITPEGLKRDHEVNPNESITDDTGRKIDFVIIGLMAVALSYFIYESRFETDSDKPTQLANSTEQTPNKAAALTADTELQPSIAVLPFENMSSDPEQDYFSDGISEELLNLLAKIPDLKVAARTSSFQFKGKTQDIQNIAQQLGVKTVLEGSVRKSGTKVRITAQLIKADDGFHMWSETYDRELTDIFAIQDEISAAIVESLKQSLGIELVAQKNSLSTIDPQAHDYYLKGLKQLHIATFESLSLAQQYFQDAVNLSPEFENAQVALAESIVEQFKTGSTGDAAVLKQAAAILDRVIEANPNNATAYYLYIILYRYFGEQELSREAFKKGLALEPYNPYLLGAVADDWLVSLRQIIQGIDLHQSYLKIVDSDPLNFLHYYHWAVINQFYYLDVETAEKMYLRAMELNPDNGNPPFFLAGLNAYDKGDLVNGIKYLKNTYDLDRSDPDAPIYLSQMYLLLNMQQQAEQYVEEALALMPTSGQARLVKAQLMTTQGNRQQAIDYINATLDNQENFYRRGSRRFIIGLAVRNYLELNQVEQAHAFILKHYPKAEAVYTMEMPTHRREIGQSSWVLAPVELAAGNKDNYKKIFERMRIMTPELLLEYKPRLSGRDHLNLAAAKVGLNQQLMFEHLEKAFELKGYIDLYQTINFSANYYHLKDHPRIKAMLEKIELEMTRQRGYLENTQSIPNN